MRKVIYAMSVSLDGFIEAADGDLSWSFPDEELHKHFNDLESTIDIHLYGRRLYENMAAYWPTADENPSAPKNEIEYARIWRNMPKIVFSRTLDQVGWNSRLVGENIAEEVNKLKAGKERPSSRRLENSRRPEAGGYLSVGGAELASTFMRLGLIDEYRLYIHPVILGGGKPMFPQLLDRIDLQLVETRTFGSGVVLLRYQHT
jgi:dihydrofolate reductase